MADSGGLRVITMPEAAPSQPHPQAWGLDEQEWISAQLQRVLLDELQKALRKELPVALEKELPRALSSSSLAPSMAHSRSFASQAGTVPPFDEEEEEDQPLKPAVSYDVGNGVANKYNAKKYLREFDTTGAKKHLHEYDQQGQGGQEKKLGRKLREAKLSGADASGGRSQPKPVLEVDCEADYDFCEADTVETQGTKSAVSSDLRKGRLTQHKKEVQLTKQSSFAKMKGNGSYLSRSQSLNNVLVPSFSQRMRMQAIRITEMPLFTVSTTLLITLNAVVIGIQTEWMAENHDAETPFAFRMIDVIFCLAFTMELGIRIYAYRWGFLRNDWQWNLFDSLLVAMQVFEICLEFALGTSSSGVNMSFMRILRILRLVRVMRLVRVVRYISELRTIIASIANSMKSLFFTMVLISFLIYIMSVFLTQLCTEYSSNSMESDSSAKEEVDRYFNGVPRSFLTLFQMMTGGIDWADAAEPVIVHISAFMAIPFSFYMAFVLFAMLNVITGVFVESALESDAEEKDATMVSRLLEFLSGCPGAEKGELTWDEFQARLNDPAMQCYFQSVDLDPGEASSLFRLMDADSSGTVEPEEFVMGCLRLRGHAKAIDLATLMYESRRWFVQFEAQMKKIQKSCGNLAGHRGGARNRPALTMQPAVLSQCSELLVSDATDVPRPNPDAYIDPPSELPGSMPVESGAT